MDFVGGNSTSRSKKQRCLTNFSAAFSGSSSGSLPLEESNAAEDFHSVEEAYLAWKDEWYGKFEWIIFYQDEGKVYCRFCREAKVRGKFGKEGATSLNVSNFIHHQGTAAHTKAAYALRDEGKGIQRALAASKKVGDIALTILFRLAYFIAKEHLVYTKFSKLCALAKSLEADITFKLYHTEKACLDFIHCISQVVQTRVLERVRASP
ncbi:hypothetical protein R1flu_025561 [Riccia fluitans]|uniref:C17orf113 probable zinc finger domain-containing protein n=1 Tax=Riccia fluitans TaxID=41844 RepID=A0ABD1XY58_9MARC